MRCWPNQYPPRRRQRYRAQRSRATIDLFILWKDDPIRATKLKRVDYALFPDDPANAVATLAPTLTRRRETCATVVRFQAARIRRPFSTACHCAPTLAETIGQRTTSQIPRIADHDRSTSIFAGARGSGARVDCVPGERAAQSVALYPNRPVKLVIPFPPGGPLDIVGRAIAQKAERGRGARALSSTTVPAPAATSAPTSSRNRRPTATRS